MKVGDTVFSQKGFVNKYCSEKCFCEFHAHKETLTQEELDEIKENFPKLICNDEYKEWRKLYLRKEIARMQKELINLQDIKDED